MHNSFIAPDPTGAHLIQTNKMRKFTVSISSKNGSFKAFNVCATTSLSKALTEANKVRTRKATYDVATKETEPEVYVNDLKKSEIVFIKPIKF